jgi:hypothetical protein
MSGPKTPKPHLYVIFIIKIKIIIKFKINLVNKNCKIKNEQRWRSFTIQNNPNREYEHRQNLLNLIICT